MALEAVTFVHTSSIKGLIAAAVVFLVACQGTILVKLWYWVVNNKLNVLQEIKQLQLQLAELTDKKPSSEN